MSRNLSKSKLIAFRQCPKRLWLEVHHPVLRADSSATQAVFAAGHQVGELAQKLYDPAGVGAVIDLRADGITNALGSTRKLTQGEGPIFEAGFCADRALAFADVLLRDRSQGLDGWRMVEIKSSTSVKDYHRDDVAIQSFVARQSGIPLTAVALAHIDTSWTYQNEGDYRGLLTEVDLTPTAFARSNEVQGWIRDAHAVAALDNPPDVAVSSHCHEPFECGFLGHCNHSAQEAEYPVTWLPRIQAKALKEYIQGEQVTDLRDLPDSLLNERQLRVKRATLTGQVFFDAEGAKADLAKWQFPAYFLDFETVQFAVPRWVGSRPFQFLPFQLSVHVLDAQGQLTHDGFLDLSGSNPVRPFAEALLAACGLTGPVFVYNAGFEGGRIRELARRFEDLYAPLMALNARLVDLLPIAEERFYHPSQNGSWSIKKVLPAVADGLDYGQLAGVQDGGMAMNAFVEAIDVQTTPQRRAELREQLWAYCRLDTLAMVKLWAFFSGREIET